MTTEARLQLIAETSATFSPWTGEFTYNDLLNWRNRELSNFQSIPPENILHIISGNTPHAAWQTLLRGLVLGAHNRLKLPRQGLPEFENHLPASLIHHIEVSRDLPDHWLAEAGAVVVYGNDETIRHFRNLAPLEIPFIGHGHRVGIAIIDDPSPEAARLAAKDIIEFDQKGCLSLQTIYLDDARAFGPLLSAALAEAPPQELTLSEYGAISNLRQEITYLAAQEPENYQLWSHSHSTVIYDGTPQLCLSPGHRTVFLKPRHTFKSERFLSGIGLYPYRERDDLPSPRIFPLGKAQEPPFAWAHDGLLPLASLVRYQERGNS